MSVYNLLICITLTLWRLTTTIGVLQHGKPLKFHFIYLFDKYSTEYFKHGIYSPFFYSKCSLFHNSNIFGSCIIHILYTECAKIKKNNSGAKRLIVLFLINFFILHFNLCQPTQINQKSGDFNRRISRFFSKKK